MILKLQANRAKDKKHYFSVEVSEVREGSEDRAIELLKEVSDSLEEEFEKPAEEPQRSRFEVER